MAEESGCLPVLVVVGIGAWFLFGNPARTVADWWWPESSAPWETVDAVYYPDKGNLMTSKGQAGLDDVQACRDWVRSEAYTNGDPTLERGDYECGLGAPEPFGAINIYRNTVR